MRPGSAAGTGGNRWAQADRLRALDASGLAAETDGDLAALDDDRHLAPAVGEFEHGVELSGVGEHVDVIDRFAVLLQGLTGRGGEGSCVFSVDQDLVRHGLPPLGMGEIGMGSALFGVKKHNDNNRLRTIWQRSS